MPDLQGKFPLDNICLLLFSDEAEFYSCENTSQMKYENDATVMFWKVGHLLMKGKFLRYCRGHKKQGQIRSSQTQRGYYDPQTTATNSVVPSLETLHNLDIWLCKEDVKPGPSDKMIDAIAQYDLITKTFNLSIDGKNINSCKYTSKGHWLLWIWTIAYQGRNSRTASLGKRNSSFAKAIRTRS